MTTPLTKATRIAEKYEVLSLLGQGGGGSVYKVRHTDLETIHALKVLPQHLGENPDLAQRFYREARVMARLTAPPHGHPNIVRVLDVGHDPALNIHYFIMEYIRGQTLRQYLRDKGALPFPEVLQIACQSARALDFAHQQAPPIVHRDIKPANIMLEDDSGRVVVMDFGIAKELGKEELTQMGTVLGTLRYCAPEQLRHEPLTGSADVYALGMVIYEMYTGQQFFKGLTEQQVIGQLLYEQGENEPSFPPSTPLAFATTVQKAIAKDPQHRYAEMRDFLSALEDCSAQSEETQTILFRDTSTYSPESLDTIEKQIQQLEKERQDIVRVQQNQARELREQARGEGAVEWAVEIFRQGLELEGRGLDHLHKQEYTLAEAAYQEAVDLFTQAREEATTARQAKDVEHARQTIALAKTETQAEQPEWELGTEDSTQILDRSHHASMSNWIENPPQPRQTSGASSLQSGQQSTSLPSHKQQTSRGTVLMWLTVLSVGLGSLVWAASHQTQEWFSWLASRTEARSSEQQHSPGIPEDPSDNTSGGRQIPPPPVLEKDTTDRTAEVQGYLSIGQLYMNRGSYQQAIAEFEKARLLQPKNSSVLASLQAARMAQEAEQKLGLITDG